MSYWHRLHWKKISQVVNVDSIQLSHNIYLVRIDFENPEVYFDKISFDGMED
jgi:hypothetical protein